MGLQILTLFVPLNVQAGLFKRLFRPGKAKEDALLDAYTDLAPESPTLGSPGYPSFKHVPSSPSGSHPSPIPSPPTSPKKILLSDSPDYSPTSFRSRSLMPGSDPSILGDAQSQYDTTPLRIALGSVHGLACGDALVAAGARDEAFVAQITELIEAMVRLQNASYTAMGHRQNILALTAFFVDVINMLDANGGRMGAEHIPLLQRIHAYIKDACEIAEPTAQPGWLVRLAKGEGLAGEFMRIHSGTLGQLRTADLDTAPHTTGGVVHRLPEPHYIDICRPVRKMLRSLGDGSLEAGLQRLRVDELAQQEAARTAEVPLQAIQREATADLLFPGDHCKFIETGPAREDDYCKVFGEYVSTSGDSVTPDGFELLMTHMGLLDNVDTFDRPAVARAALVAADGDYDGALDFQEFRAFYSRYPITAVRLHLRMSTSLELEHRVREVFLGFSVFGVSKPRSFGGATPRNHITPPRATSAGVLRPGDSETGLDAMRFAKLCRDCGLLSRGMTTQLIDVVFINAKARGSRRLDFDHFLAALAMVAERRGETLDQVVRRVAEAPGPAIRGMRAGYVRQHDDPSKKSGISSRGGPHSGPVNVDIRLLVDRSKSSPALPPPSGSQPPKFVPTQPESPKLHTRWRVQSQGPCTPGRGAPLHAVEAKANIKAAAMATPRGPPSVFGRACTPRAAEVAARSSSRKKKPSPLSGVSAKSQRSDYEGSAPRQLFAEPGAAETPSTARGNYASEDAYGHDASATRDTPREDPFRSPSHTAMISLGGPTTHDEAAQVGAGYPDAEAANDYSDSPYAVLFASRNGESQGTPRSDFSPEADQGAYSYEAVPEEAEAEGESWELEPRSPDIGSPTVREAEVDDNESGQQEQEYQSAADQYAEALAAWNSPKAETDNYNDTDEDAEAEAEFDSGSPMAEGLERAVAAAMAAAKAAAAAANAAAAAAAMAASDAPTDEENNGAEGNDWAAETDCETPAGDDDQSDMYSDNAWHRQTYYTELGNGVAPSDK